ncbi:hypothetical protein [Brevibacillus massiliensis]|jgi:hypothetical protein|uniref:hypothetical protein n=1 Tax=Brevibacillus massiliensis TaxID=1118054 RepID=UPI0003198A97|nr:hypothetical protein [Brevibacillus massiliensis]
MMKKKSVFMALRQCRPAAWGMRGGAGQPAASGGTNQEKDSTCVVKISYENQPGEPIDLAANEWKRIAEEKSGGKLKLEEFLKGMLPLYVVLLLLLVIITYVPAVSLWLPNLLM